ncbi:hypothetical protein E0L36_22570 [Streptomyces sp. AJS327]|nr:hypothetical protein [Streptomyces sp. AJS327]
MQKKRRGDVRVILGSGCETGSGGKCTRSERAQARENSREIRRILKNGKVPVRVCGKSCLVGRDGKRGKIMHAKFFLIQKGSDRKVVQTSTNFMDNQMRHAQDLIVVPDRGLFRFYEQYWNRMWKRQWGSWGGSDARRSQFGSANGTVGHAYPRVGRDPVIKVLNQVNCAGKGRVRLINSDPLLRGKGASKRKYLLVSVLNRLRREGCDVRVITKDREPFGKVRTRNGVIHNKVLLVDARFDGQQRKRQLVFTGSHNLRSDATRGTSDVMLRVERPWVYRQYVTYFDQNLWKKLGRKS